MSAEIIKLLRKTPIFSTLDSSSLKKITGFFKNKTFAAEEMLYKEGTLGDTLYIIRDGAIKITRAAREGEEETSRSLRREGDIFGESGFIDETPRPTTAQATKETKVLELSRSDFLTILNNDPLIAYQIVKVLSSRLKQSNLRQIEELKEKCERHQQICNQLQEKIETSQGKVQAGYSPTPINEEESLSHQVLSQIPHSIILTDAEDNILIFNRTAERQFGHKRQETIGKPVGQLWDEIPWKSTVHSIDQQLKTGGIWEGQIIARKSDGERFAFHATVFEVLDIKGENLGRIYLSSDAVQSQLSDIHKETLDLKSFFEEELLALKTHERFRDITIVNRFEEEIPSVKADKKQLKQLLFVILDNAASALQPVSGQAKTITIEADGINVGREVQIMISDNGVGISPKNLTKMFKEPFTTKPDGSGSGLLLADKIVKEHGGSIEVHSEEGAYTLFIIKFPACEEKATTVPQAEPALESHA